MAFKVGELVNVDLNGTAKETQAWLVIAADPAIGGVVAFVTTEKAYADQFVAYARTMPKKHVTWSVEETVIAEPLQTMTSATLQVIEGARRAITLGEL